MKPARIVATALVALAVVAVSAAPAPALRYPFNGVIVVKNRSPTPYSIYHDFGTDVEYTWVADVSPWRKRTLRRVERDVFINLCFDPVWETDDACEVETSIYTGRKRTVVFLQ